MHPASRPLIIVPTYNERANLASLVASLVETRPMSRIADTFEEVRTHCRSAKRVVLVPDF